MLYNMLKTAVLLAVSSVLKILIIIHELYYKKQSGLNTKLKTTILFSLPFLFQTSFEMFEFIIRLFVFGGNAFLTTRLSFWIGLLFIITGWFIRSKAIHHFCRRVENNRKESNEKKKFLITTGIYYYIRHPNYLGTLLFIVGIEMFLQNYISVIVTISIVWKYFSDLIQEEETNLVALFGNEFVTYRNNTPTYIPYID